jgi:hypothetical protein
MKVIPVCLTVSVPDKGYSSLLALSVLDEGYSSLLTLSLPDEGYSSLFDLHHVRPKSKDWNNLHQVC